MISRMVRTARHYIEVSRNLSNHGHSSLSSVLPRIITSRIFYGMGPALYDRRRFSEKTLCQAREYLSLREKEYLQKSLCPKEAWKLVENKLHFHEKCLSHGLPTPRVFGALMIRDAYVPDGIPTLRTEREFRNFLLGLPPGEYVVKPVDGGHGWGLSAIRIVDGRVTDFFGRSIDPDELRRQCIDNRHNFAG
jgi:hypothetical protein